MGFEQRIQERRFRALVETLNGAIARRDAVAARAAIEEARELKPAAPELDAYDIRINAIPVAPPAVAMRLTLSRAMGAVAMLLVGISLVTGIDYVRSLPEPATASLDTTVASAPATVEDTPVSLQSEEAAPADVLAATEAAAFDSQPLGAEPRGTAGLMARDDESVPLVPARPVPAAANAFVDEPLAAANVRETQDEFVFRGREIEPLPPAARAVPDVMPPPLPAASIAPQAVRQPTPFPLQPPPPPAATAVVATRPQDESRVTNVLNAYARAYRDLDAGAARAVWPTVNERALARAFASLDSQNLSFDDCQIELNGTTANASCRGRASYVGKVGSREPRVEARLWQFQLRRDGDEWKIENAEARRQ